MIYYSIIIPHYNSPNLLKRCLESIPKRNDIQIIVVDDNSTQNNIIQLKTIKQQFPYVLFIQATQNKGAGQARNIGLKHAIGEWVLFADADDYFSINFSNEIDSYKTTDADIVFFNAKSENPTTKRTIHLNYIYSLQNNSTKQLLLRYSFGEPWCKMVRLKLIKEYNIFFDQSFIHNDTRFSYLIGFFAKKIAYTSQIIYIVTKQPKSVSQQYSKELLIQRAKIFTKKNAFLHSNHIKYFDWLMMNPLWNAIKTVDFNFIKQYMSICHHYNFSTFFIFRKIVHYTIKVILRKCTGKIII